jgi:hypothetical protein
MSTNLEVANEILNQLGGRRFMVMTGAKNFVGSENSLSFKLPSKPHYVKDGINAVRITLTPADDYTVEFLKIRKFNVQTVAVVDQIYNDTLRQCFTNRTGLETSMGSFGRRA